MKDRSTGGFRVHQNGETDMRGCYCAIAVASMLKMITPELEEGVVGYIHRCQTWEGGIAGEPGLEAHGGYAFCGLAAATMLGKAEEALNLERMARWVCQRQLAFEGGFNGRANKLVDSCYSYWQYGSLSILRSLLHIPQEEKAWCAPEPLQMYLLLACQERERGGFRDKPGKNCDYYHTCYALSGMAASQWHRGSPPTTLGENTLLIESDVLYNISKEARRRLEKYFADVPNITHDECFGSILMAQVSDLLHTAVCCNCTAISDRSSGTGFYTAPCGHAYCESCLHRVFCLSSRITCRASVGGTGICGRLIERGQMKFSSSVDLVTERVTQTRRKVYEVMNKSKFDCSGTPEYDQFLAEREDMVQRLLDDSDASKQRLAQQELERYEISHGEQIAQTRNIKRDDMRRNLQRIVDVEGTFYERVNAPFSERDKEGYKHPLEVEFAELFNDNSSSTTAGSSQKTTQVVNQRRARTIRAPIEDRSKRPRVDMAALIRASGAEGVWERRAEDEIRDAFKRPNSVAAS
ncbi:hypothetical protein FOZ60_003813 [Perkinsus olseni]|uniref:CAAX farnesyltransferase subunit beta n=1 Tax=Perkinsus olseni TaxID=32597 RepID=A0A7J6NWV3_PEROL|nr:hypothetical protein FOZ60_003813 [Perkinsus olseni]